MSMTPIEFRQHLHQYPELSFLEQQTAAFISTALTEEGITHRPVARTGVLATIQGRGDLRQALVLRADIDALPIQELTPVAWRSQRAGVMHACGHDLHAAVLFGVLCQLAATRDFDGTIFGLFQPGEECNPGGASLVLAEDPFAEYQVRAVIGEHVEPQLEVGTFGFRAGKYMASSDELRFTITGTGGHAAMRHELHDPVAAAAALITALLGLNTPECVLSIGRIQADGATNIIPQSVYLEGTLRTFDEQHRQQIKEQIVQIAMQLDAQHATQTESNISRGYPCVVNSPQLTAQAVALATAQGHPTVMLPLRTTAEDFGFYGTRYPSLFYRLGVGSAAGKTHSATFNPHTGAINMGIDFMRDLALQISKQ